MVRRLYVDDRWSGEHGIGRFATEVLARLRVPWRPLSGSMSATSPLDVLNYNRLRLGSKQTIFSPGFNAGLTLARQLIVIHDLIHLSSYVKKSLAKSLYYDLVVRAAVRRAGVVMTVSETSAIAIAKWVNDADVKIVVVGNGCSESFTEAGDRAVFDRPTFLYVGNLKSHKNVDILFDAIRLRPQYQLMVVTNDVDLARSAAQSHGVESQVIVRTGVSDPDLAALYRGVTAALQPSFLEGFGLPALEAMSSGTRVGYWVGCASVREICAGSGVGVAVASSAFEWAGALDELEEMSHAGPLRMSPEWYLRYDWDTVGAKVLEVVKGAQESVSR